MYGNALPRGLACGSKGSSVGGGERGADATMEAGGEEGSKPGGWGNSWGHVRFGWRSVHRDYIFTEADERANADIFFLGVRTNTSREHGWRWQTRIECTRIQMNAVRAYR